MDNDPLNPLASLLSGLILAYVELALELHDHQALDKDVLAQRLRTTAARTDFNMDEVARNMLKHIAGGLEISAKEGTK